MSDRKFVWVLAFVVAALAVVPAIYGLLSTPPGARYLGYQYNTDDHMVYSAWMRQAMDGRFFFDNRFTTDAQPGLTVHLYFFLLGLVAKLTGIALAATLARVGFSILFVSLAYRFVRRLEWDSFTTKLALVILVFGGGLGFLVWHSFGKVDVLHPPMSALIDWATPGLPVDVWQPEGFVFPSMLTNSLFMVSLCLILLTFEAFLSARDSWRAVLPGALALGVLMNIHSYDALLIGLVMVAFVAASLAQRQITAGWLVRAAVIAAGMIVPALWFFYVLRHDPVFQSRAATKTFSPNFRQVVFGYLPLMVFGLYGMWTRATNVQAVAAVETSHDGTNHPSTTNLSKGRWRRPGVGVAVLLFVALFAAASVQGDAYFLGAPAFAFVFLLAGACVVLLSGADPVWNLFVAWALVGTVAIYFPGLFQRKLTMGLSVPWGVLAGYGLATIVSRQSASSRRLLCAAAGVVLGATSLLWMVREVSFIRMDVSSTGRDPVYLTADEGRVVDYINAIPGRKVVLAVPGSNTPALDASGHPIPDALLSPSLPDLAPFLSGLAGAYTYAGHWSETPDYGRRASDMYRFFFNQPVKPGQPVMSPEDRRAFANSVGADYAVLPMADAYPGIPFVSAEDLGDVVVPGKQFSLVKLRR